MGYLIDSDVLVDVQRGHESPLRSLTGFAAVSVVTVSELLQGASYGTPDVRVRRRIRIEELLSLFEALPVTWPVARVRADLWAYLREAGTPIGANDLWIAATAIAHDLELVTRNTREFSRVPALRLVAA